MCEGDLFAKRPPSRSPPKNFRKLIDKTLYFCVLQTLDQILLNISISTLDSFSLFAVRTSPACPTGSHRLACGLGHARGLTRHRRVIQDPRAASLPQRGGLTQIRYPRSRGTLCSGFSRAKLKNLCSQTGLASLFSPSFLRRRKQRFHTLATACGSADARRRR